MGIGNRYVNEETTESNSFNEQLTVQSDDQAMFLRPMRFAFQSGERDTNLSLEGAAEFFWGMFLGPLQRG